MTLRLNHTRAHELDNCDDCSCARVLESDCKEDHPDSDVTNNAINTNG